MRALFLAGSLILTALVATGASLTGDEPQKPHNIAVVSKFETTMYKIRIGLGGLFDDSDETKDVSEWHIAETSETDMVALLKQKGVGENVAVLHQTGPRAHGGEGRHDEQLPLIQLAREAGFDTIVVIQPDKNDTFPLLKPGYGICGKPQIIDPIRVYAYALFEVEVFRTADAKLIDWQYGYRSSRFFGEGPCDDLGAVPWKDTLAEYTAEDMATVEAAVKARIQAGLARALDHLDFQ